MKKRCQTILCWAAAGLVWMLSLLVTAHEQHQGAVTLNDFHLPRLWGTQSITLADWQHQWKVVTFFEPECGWCRKQLQAFEMLSGRYEVPILAIGVHGDRAALRRMLPRASRLTAVIGDDALLRALGGIKSTPLTLLVDENGHIRYRVHGYVAAETSAALLAAAQAKSLP